MQSDIFLVANRNGVHRMTKRSPDLSRGEVAVAISVEIPDECFKSPIIKVDKVSVDPDLVFDGVATVQPRRRRLDLGES